MTLWNMAWHTVKGVFFLVFFFNFSLFTCLLRDLLTGLSLRAGGRGFSPATKGVVPSYFYWKIEEK